MTQFFETVQGAMVLGSLIAFVGVLVGWIAASAPELPRRIQATRPSRKAMQRDVAMRTILALDDFVGAAYAAVHDTPEFQADDQSEFFFHTDDPIFVLPTDVDWQNFKRGLAEEIRWLPNRIQNVFDGLDALDLSAPNFSDFFQHRQEDFARLGLEALYLIDRLSDQYGVQRPVRPAYYHPEVGLRKKVSEIEAFWQRRRSSQVPVPNDGSNVTPLFSGSRSVPARSDS